MNSLRARQLISSFTIIVASIFILGLLLVMFVSRQELETEQKQLRDISFDLLGYLSYDKGKFYIEDSNIEDFKGFLQRYHFSDSLRGTTAYIQNTNTKLVRWHSVDVNAELSEQLESRFNGKFQEKLEVYDVHVEPTQQVIKKLYPQKTDQDSSLKQIVYAYGFRHPQQGYYQLVIARPSTSLLTSDPETYRILILLFAASAMLVLFAQLATSYWVISPIKDFEQEIKRLESGEQETIVNNYPDEIKPLQSTINALLQSEVGQKRRYRDALDDLAHSLKTPLSAIQGYIEQEKDTDEKKEQAFKGISNQLEAMKGIVSYQLRRAVVSNQHSMITPTPLRPVLVRLKESLLKVHHTKSFDIDIKVESDIKVRIDNEDLLELFGNLLHNACRFCDSLVEVNIQPDNTQLIINIDDDGMGFPDNNPSKLLKRGIRADSKTEGQGIGLAVCTEIVHAAGGSIELLVSPQVGARVRIRLPM